MKRVEQRALDHVWRVTRARGAHLALFLPMTLCGCSVIGTITGVVAGVATGTFTSNPAVGVSVAIAVKAGFDEAGRYYARRTQAVEHDAIARAAGLAQVGETATWQVSRGMVRTRAVGGDVLVVRLIDTPLTVCKEFLFTGGPVDPRPLFSRWFTAHACQNGARWEWAVAEPAVGRWTNLQ